MRFALIALMFLLSASPSFSQQGTSSQQGASKDGAAELPQQQPGESFEDFLKRTRPKPPPPAVTEEMYKKGEEYAALYADQTGAPYWRAKIVEANAAGRLSLPIENLPNLEKVKIKVGNEEKTLDMRWMKVINANGEVELDLKGERRRFWNAYAKRLEKLFPSVRFFLYDVPLMGVGEIIVAWSPLDRR